MVWNVKILWLTKIENEVVSLICEKHNFKKNLSFSVIQTWLNMLQNLKMIFIRVTVTHTSTSNKYFKSLKVKKKTQKEYEKWYNTFAFLDLNLKVLKRCNHKYARYSYFISANSIICFWQWKKELYFRQFISLISMQNWMSVLIEKRLMVFTL
jgi:hypothetical protein